MEIQMEPRQKQMLDDVFGAFSMLAGGNYVSLMHVEGGVTRYSPGAVELFNLPGEYIQNGAYNWIEYVHPEDRKRYLDVMGPLAAGKIFTYDVTYRVRTKDGSYVSTRQVGAVLRNAEGAPSLIGGMIVNQGVTENTDPITVLRNKFGFLEDLSKLARENVNAVVLLAGISKLSSINQVYGYSYGNRVLQETAWLIQETAGSRGTVYRMDDATFAFMTTGHSREEVAAIYDSIRLSLQRGIRVDGIRHTLAANGGLLSTESGQTDPWTICACLNYAYRESKIRKHGELVDFNGSFNFDQRRSLELINAIRDCIVEGCRGFTVSYQPVFNMETEKPIGVEALVRWKGEPYGVVEPMEFIPILEKDFVFEELGSWMLHQAASDGVRFLEKDPNFILGLNISLTQLEDEYFIDSVEQALEETGFPAQNLCLEITKDCRLLDEKLLEKIVDELHKRHIRVIIDDFGAGFESIGFLKKLSADFVKFDRALLEGIEQNEADRESVSYLARLASIHGANVCVKGVETEQMRDILREFPIRSMQGNYFCSPLPVDEVVERLFG